MDAFFRFFTRLVTGFGLFVLLGNLFFGKRINAVVRLTIKAAFRYRLFWVLLALLIGGVIGLPVLIKDDGTARGFTQILLTYTLALITALLGFTTLWLACGTLARDIEEAHIQVVAVKPVARWQIWLGKWIGIVVLNSALLGLAGGSVFFLLKWRASRLPPDQQRVLQNEIFVARASQKEARVDLRSDVESVLKERIKASPVTTLDVPILRKQIEEQMKAGLQIVQPNYLRRWTIDFGLKRRFLQNQPLFVRYKFNAAQTNASGTYLGLWEVGPPDTDRRAPSRPMSVSADTFHEFAIPSSFMADDGKLTLDFINRNDTALLFPIDDGLEVLYRDGGFGLNFCRGLGIILCWLGLLAAVGLMAASFLSFPVAAFFSLTVLVVGLSSGTLSRVLEEGSVMGVNHETGVADSKSVVDFVMLPLFRGLLHVITLVEGFSPIDSLSTGRSITWGSLGSAFAQVVLLVGGLFALIGIVIFTRRELATAQGTS